MVGNKDIQDAAQTAIAEIAGIYRERLQESISGREADMYGDDTRHYIIYRVLGISSSQGYTIDLHQNIGRFLYRYAGAFLEEAATICLMLAYPESEKVRINNTLGIRPKTFEIDCLCGNRAPEIKWRDATTDGDHITKEHTRIRVIADAGLIPVRVMFYYPQRTQAKRIQSTLKTLYEGVGGEYYAEDDAWKYILETTGVDLLHILEEIADDVCPE